MKEDPLFSKLLVILFLVGCGLLTHFGMKVGFLNIFRFLSIILLACTFISFLYFILLQVIQYKLTLKKEK